MNSVSSGYTHTPPAGKEERTGASVSVDFRVVRPSEGGGDPTIVL